MKKTLFAICFVVTAAMVQAQNGTSEGQTASHRYNTQCKPLLQ